MNTEYTSHNFTTNGETDGGLAYGVGFTISWQRGCTNHDNYNSKTSIIGAKPNGAFVEDIIDVCIGRLEHLQSTLSAVAKNDMAIAHLKEALGALQR